MQNHSPSTISQGHLKGGRGIIGKHIAQFINLGIPFLIKGKNSKTALRLASGLSHDTYYYINSTTQVIEFGIIPIKKIDGKEKLFLIILLLQFLKNKQIV